MLLYAINFVFYCPHFFFLLLHITFQPCPRFMWQYSITTTTVQYSICSVNSSCPRVMYFVPSYFPLFKYGRPVAHAHRKKTRRTRGSCLDRHRQSWRWLRLRNFAVEVAVGPQCGPGGGSPHCCCSRRRYRWPERWWRVCTAAPRSAMTCSGSLGRPPKWRSLGLTGSWLAATTRTGSDLEIRGRRERLRSQPSKSSCSLPRRTRL